MKKLILISLTLLLFGCNKVKEEVNYADYVMPLIGSQSVNALSNGNTYPAVARPWGMHFWTPQTGLMGHGWTYTYDTPILRGFKQTHQPSPWMNDYGQFAVMPVSNWRNVDQEVRKSWFSHKVEVSKAYYYSVYLADHDVTTEMTTTSRSAYFKVKYPKADSSGFVIDAYDQGSYIKIVDNQTIEGYSTRNSGGVGDNFHNWFVVKFAEPFIEAAIYCDGEKLDGVQEHKGNHVIASVRFATNRADVKNIRIASSFIDIAQAHQNLKESENITFENLVAQGKDEWNDVLSRIEAEGGSEKQLTTFYSCLYRSLLFPRALYEITADGEIVHYSPYNSKVEKGYLFGDTGFWDTFRALMPLINLAYPDMAEKFQIGLLNTYRESGFFPEWATPGHRWCMVGNNSASVIADVYMRGIHTDNALEYFEGMEHGAHNVHPTVNTTGRYGHQYYNTLGYVPFDVGIRESAARTLEYAYNDWCIWKMGQKMGLAEDRIQKYKERAQNYKNLFDNEHKLMRGKDSLGRFETPFSPYKWGGVFTEGNAWHYTWSVFHDIKGLQDLMGGKEEFTAMLDSVFVVPPIYDDSYYGKRIHEITEMQIANMGNYAHGNQPAQHMPYLYDYVGQPWKTQYWVREIMNRLYTPMPDGYCGDEDNGQTSAWYVFSAMGFYPVCPVAGEYALGAPLFDKVTLHRPNGSDIVINAKGNSLGDNRYVEKMKLDGKTWQKNYITFEQVENGAELSFTMSDKPNYDYRTSEEAAPYSMSNESQE